MRNRGIGRGRIFLGTLLLLAAVLTWSIGLMMSPHGDTVARGTEYLRSTIVIFKRNGAIGTLILCALGAWLLFPARRPKWPARDWALIALLAFLAGTSLYTLIWLEMTVPNAGNAQENLEATDMNIDSNLSGGGALSANAAEGNSWVMPQGAGSPADISAGGSFASRKGNGERPSAVNTIKEPSGAADVPAPSSDDESSSNQTNEE